MNEIPIVKMEAQPSLKSQWGMGLFFKNDGGKKILNTKFALIFFTVLLSLAVLLASILAPTKLTVNSEDRIKTAEATAAKEAVNLQIYDEKSYESSMTELRSDNALASVSKRIWGLQKIIRPEILKVPPGTYGAAKLLGVATNGLVRAEIIDAVKVAGDTVLPSGTLLLGQGSSSDERLIVSFRKAANKDGTVMEVEAQACDPSDKMIGVAGEKMGKEALKLTAAVGLNFASGLSQGLQDQSMQYGMPTRPPSLKNGLLNGASSAAIEQSKGLMEDLKNQPPVVVVPEGKEICLIFGGV